MFAFVLTDASSINGFTPSLAWQFLIPICIGSAICVAVAMLIWPEDSVTNYMTVLTKGLEAHNAFFKEHSEAFLGISPISSSSYSQTAPTSSSLSVLHDRLQNNTLTLIDCKRAVHRDILFSRINAQDISKLTQLTKTLQSPLYGIGVSHIVKDDICNSESDHQITMLKDTIQEINHVFEPVAEACYGATINIIERLHELHDSKPRSTLNSILWPFPRLFTFNKRQQHDPEKAGNESAKYTAEGLSNILHQCNSVDWWAVVAPLQQHHEPLSLYVVSFYRHQLSNYCQRLISLLEFIEQVESIRKRRRLWIPSHKAIRKWFQRTHQDVNHDGTDGMNEETLVTGLSLVRTNTRTETYEQQQQQPRRPSTILSPASHSNTRKTMYYRDPDVDPPTTRMQRFWFKMHRLYSWLLQPQTFFAFKAAGGCCVLALPFYLPWTVDWYMEWRGNWALIILQVWASSSMSGLFFFNSLLRFAGTAFGGILGMLVWEMTRSNPYGMAVLLFVGFVLLYHVFVSKPMYRVVPMLTAVTMMLVVLYSYNFKVGVFQGNWPVYVIAGKRVLLVIIGLAAASIITMFPTPMTARVELRKRLAQTLRNIGGMYSILASQILIPETATMASTEEQAKGFRRLALELQRQIADERSFLQLSTYEPPLRGRFPKENYISVLQHVSTMADLVYLMGTATNEMQAHVRHQIAEAMAEHRRDYAASIVTIIKLLATTLSSKMALPPYMIAPEEARERYARALKNRITIRPDNINHSSFFCYSAYVVTSTAFVQELQNLLEVVERLVGVEDPQEWLRMHIS
ncbi:hypothetical protein K492DRAFT_2038 [Lichtheimia hyalospora FSU 10163]|nr:hypothetical protein K492DRAFT_2038 [Lichtheimia hyalospora FSU 10163]